MCNLLGIVRQERKLVNFFDNLKSANEMSVDNVFVSCIFIETRKVNYTAVL